MGNPAPKQATPMRPRPGFHRRRRRGHYRGRERSSSPPRPPSPPHRSRWADSWQFFRSFLRRPLRVGSLLPSSRSLARAMLAGCPLRQARTVVEFGPGTGAFTGLLLENIGPRTLFLALELDAEHVRRLQQRYPRARVYRDSAEYLGRYLHRHRVRTADCMISGLPWANMKPAAQDRILDTVLWHLAADGTFVAFSYLHARWLPGAKRFRAQLEKRFAEVAVSPVVWGNLPPAVVYRCRGPRRPGTVPREDAP